MNKESQGVKIDIRLLKVEFSKVCACGVSHSTLPQDNRYFNGMFYFNCTCGSTLCVYETQSKVRYLEARYFSHDNFMYQYLLDRCIFYHSLTTDLGSEYLRDQIDRAMTEMERLSPPPKDKRKVA